jgi:TFIIF-interacting CTD phosphatase-like protein
MIQNLKKYASEVVEELDTNKKIAYLLCRENCKTSPLGVVKDLSQLNRELKNVILVDVFFFYAIFF